MKSQRHFRLSLGACFQGLGLLAALLTISVLSSLLIAGEPLPLDPLTPSEIEMAKTTTLNDARVKQSLNDNKDRYRIVYVERRDHPKETLMTAERGAVVTIYNYTKDEALSVAVRLGSKPAVDAMATTRTQQPALSPEEVAEAQQLALADPVVRERLKGAGVVNNVSSDLIITYLFAKAMNQEDTCSSHRCVLLFFNTKDAVLDINPIIDLSAQEVHCQ